MRHRVIGDLITHARSQLDDPTILQLRRQIALHAKKHMSLGTPVIGQISRAVSHETHSDIAKLLRAPKRFTRLTGMARFGNGRPIGRRKGDVRHVHARNSGKTQ
jgi:hypothetical protein